MRTQNIMIAALGAMAFAVPALADTTTTAPVTPSAQQQCRTERDAGPAAFKQTYGGKSNAFGKCVSHRASATGQAARDAHTNAAKQCRDEQSQDPSGFKSHYGTGKNGSNAFGKCVSDKAKAQTTATVKAEVKAEINAGQTCLRERKADPVAFKAKYGGHSNAMGKCVSAIAKAQQDKTQS